MDFDEVNDRGVICLTGCTPCEGNGIAITVSEAYRDDPDAFLDEVLLTCDGGNHGIKYSLDTDQARALAHLLLSTAAIVDRMSRIHKEPLDHP